MGRFNIMIVGQKGRLAAEAVLFAASLRRCAPAFDGRLFVAEPQPGPLWPDDRRMAQPDVYAALDRLGAELLPFQSKVFGARYPNGNKVEALAALPADPFVFFDTDTLITGPLDEIAFDFDKPSASMRRSGTWPTPELYGPDYGAIWASLYSRLGLDFQSSLDLSQPDDHWERFLYFNAGWFFGANPQDFADRMANVMQMIETDPPAELAGQALFPWLDQIALPLVIHALGGGRPNADAAGLDGQVALHYRALPLFYATGTDDQIALLESLAQTNWIKKALKTHKPFHRMLYRGDGARVRALFGTPSAPVLEEKLRKRLKRKGLWMR